MTILATHGFPWSELVISLIGGLIGGLTGGFFAVLAQDKAIRAQRESDREAEEREVDGVLRSIEHELNEIEHGFLAPLEAAFPENCKSDQSGLPLKTPSINQNLFTDLRFECRKNRESWRRQDTSLDCSHLYVGKAGRGYFESIQSHLPNLGQTSTRNWNGALSVPTDLP